LYNDNRLIIEDDDGCSHSGCGCGSKLIETFNINLPLCRNLLTTTRVLWYDLL